MARYYFIIFSALMVLCECAPKRSKKGENVPHTIYDQQQTGDYNIQLHLKDFQIIAVLGDDVSFGDYDYTYDYSEFTIKPATQKPTEPSISSSTVSSSQPSTSVSPYPFDNVKSTSSNLEITKPEVNNVSIETFTSTEKPISTNATEEKPVFIEPSSDSEKPTDKPVSSAQTLELEEKPDPEYSVQLIIENTPAPDNSSTTKKSSKLEDANSPGKIKVQIIESPLRLSAVLGEDSEQNETSPTGEILQIRRCATGFNKDKRGRCRRVRKPTNVQQHIPFAFSRLASNLASRFRKSSVESSISSSESKED